MVEETLGWGARDRGASLAELFQGLVRHGGSAETDLAKLRHRLRALRLMPAALLAGAQQSWRSGTQEVLDALDPKAIEQSVRTRIPVLRDAAAFKELRRQHEQFWGQLEKNLDHYYRTKFERIYAEKMEDGS